MRWAFAPRWLRGALLGELSEKEAAGGGAARDRSRASARSAPKREWRTANTNSIRSAASDAGIRREILRRPAEAGKPDQGAALVHRTAGRCASRFRRVVETGWETVLREAKAAAISVIVSRSRRRRAGRLPAASRCSARTSSKKGARPGAGCSRTRRIARATSTSSSCRATVGSAPANDRKRGFLEIIAADPRYKDHPFANGRLHARARQGSHGGVPEGGRQTHQRARTPTTTTWRSGRSRRSKRPGSSRGRTS